MSKQRPTSNYRNVVRQLSNLLDKPDEWTWRDCAIRHRRTGIHLYIGSGRSELMIWEPYHFELRFWDRWYLWPKVRKVIATVKVTAVQERAANLDRILRKAI